jgi:hypothetical protein
MHMPLFATAKFSREKDSINKKAAMLRKASPLLVASFARS